MSNETIGIIATASIVIGFMFSNEQKIRILNAVGAALYIVYGILIRSYSNILLNSILIAVHTYKLINNKSKG